MGSTPTAKAKTVGGGYLVTRSEQNEASQLLTDQTNGKDHDLILTPDLG